MLTEVEVKQAKAKEKPHRLSDQGGLYLEVSPKGSKYWRYKYRISTGAQRIEKRLALGVYPEISLKNARELHREAHALVSQGGDPSLEKLEQKALAEVASLNTFGSLGEDWFATQSPDWSLTHAIRQRRLFGKDLLPLHELAIDKIAAPELLCVLRVIESRGALETARRTNQVASKIFDHAIAMGAAEVNPAIGIKNAPKKFGGGQKGPRHLILRPPKAVFLSA
jgi:hypothetical protein